MARAKKSSHRTKRRSTKRKKSPNLRLLAKRVLRLEKKVGLRHKFSKAKRRESVISHAMGFGPRGY